MYKASDIAQYFINHSYDGMLDDVTNLKLQKLLYYAQGYSLALLDRPLFEEEIVHWRHGTVVPCVYEMYKSNGSQIIPTVPTFDMGMFSTNVTQVLELVCSRYAQYTASKLRNMTHGESPWLDTKSGDIITKDAIKSFFSVKLKYEEFNFDLERMEKAINSGFVEMPSDLETLEDFDNWLNSVNTETVS